MRSLFFMFLLSGCLPSGGGSAGTDSKRFSVECFPDRCSGVSLIAYPLSSANLGESCLDKLGVPSGEALTTLRSKFTHHAGTMRFTESDNYSVRGLIGVWQSSANDSISSPVSGNVTVCVVVDVNSNNLFDSSDVVGELTKAYTGAKGNCDYVGVDNCVSGFTPPKL